MYQLVTQWDTLPSEKKGELTGYALGKHGADILAPGALAKVAAKSVRSAQELVSISNRIQIAQKTLVLETAAGIGNSAKIAEVVHLERQISKWLGEGTKFIRNEAGDSIFLSKDGLKCVRFDFNKTKPHNNPHAHVEVKVNDKWVKSGQIYPINVPHN